MEIKWLGHSCFLLISENGVRVLMDPPSPVTGYTIEPVDTDVVTISHDHEDHNYYELAKGNPQCIKDAGKHTIKGVDITGIPVWHDEVHGAKRGPNMMYIVEMDNMRILHAGDLGHELDAQTAQAVGNIDVLLTPIGGVYTIDHNQAIDLANMLKPKVVIPMHYKTPDVIYKLGGLLPFLNAAKDCAIHRLRQCEATLTKESLGNDRIITLAYAGKREK
ncbi:MAG: MBL fold metallo-hydrolase [Clostridia bacterium]